MKNHAAALHLASILPLQLGAQILHGDIHIHHSIAAVADKVCMRIGVGVQPLHTAHGGHADYFAAFTEESQVAVNRSQTEIRVLGFELRVNPFRRGVRFTVADACENRIALLAVPAHGCHGCCSFLASSIINNNYRYCYYT